MMEIFKDIEGYEGYQVSNLGRVKSFKRGKEKFLRNKRNKGYIFVFLYKEGKRKECSVHRLVANAFLPNPDNLPQINHKDEDKSNNNVDNLEWCSASYNMNYATRPLIASKTVYQYSLNGEFVAEYPSTMEVQRQLGFAHTHISYCCNGKRKQAYGYIWRY